MSNKGNPYRGWTMVERTNGIFITKDNLHYKHISTLEHGRSSVRFSNRLYDRFHLIVDEMEDK